MRHCRCLRHGLDETTRTAGFGKRCRIEDSSLMPATGPGGSLQANDDTHHPGGRRAGGNPHAEVQGNSGATGLARLSGGTRMKFPSRYALLVCGPLTIWGVGCSAMTHKPVAHAGRDISTSDRLLSMAQV